MAVAAGPPEVTGGKLDVDTLVSWVHESRERVLDLVADLDEPQLIGPLLETVNPPIWEVGHLAWFQEAFVLRRACSAQPILAEAEALYDSAAIPHDTRWQLKLPSREDTLGYLREVTARVADRVAGPDATAALRHFARYAVHHDDMHSEALTYTRQTLGYRSPRFSTEFPEAPGEPTGPSGPLPGDVAVPGGVALLGADRDEEFVFDNEKWIHPVKLEPFRIAKAPVTQSEYASFVADGGYDRRVLWDDEAWGWRQSASAGLPLYWRRSTDGSSERRHFDRWVPLEPHRPVVHVCWYEAKAYCRWSGRRLPSEAEWETAALGQSDGGRGLATKRRRMPWGQEPASPRLAQLDWRGMDTSDVAAYPAGYSAFGCRQMVGNVWEWTDTTFRPYPNFEQDAYRDNSWPWFGTRKVLRGGAWATRSRLVRGTLRNYFTPDRRDVFAGFRTVGL